MSRYALGEEYDFSEVQAEASLPGNYELEVELLTSAVKERQSSVVFSVTRGGSVTSEPLIIDGVVYITACDHNIYAIDLETGKERWRFSSQGPNVSGPYPGKGRIYFGSYDGNLYCLNLEGKLEWKFDAGDKIAGRPIVHRNHVFFGCRNGNAYAVDLDGRLEWKLRAEDSIGNTPAAFGDVVYFGSFDFNLYALNLRGRLLWRFATGGAVGIPAISNRLIYFGSFDHCLYALDLKGKLRWKFMMGDAFDPGSGIIVEGDTVYFGSKDFNLYAIRNGKELWRFPTGNLIYSEAVISGDILYFGSGDGNLYCLDKKSGRELWRFAAGGPVLYVEKSGRKIVFGCHDCNLYCISTKGELLWKFHTSLNYPISVEPETEVEHTVIIPSLSVPSNRKAGEAVKQELGSYGDLKGNYIGEDMRDYMGSEVKEGAPGMRYRTGKKLYR